MKPALFDYVAPDSIGGAVDALGTDELARPLAGGQSLVPAMNFRYAMPSKLVDLRRIRELKGISVLEDTIRIGAMTRHRELELDETTRRANPLIAEIMANVAHIVVRNRGTIGGSLAHADAAAELPCLLLATGGSVHAEGPDGRRTIPAEAFFRFHLTTSLEPRELLTDVDIPVLPAHTGYAFQEVARRHGDYALAGVCTLLTIREGVCTAARLCACGIGSTPVRLAAAEAALTGSVPEEDRLEEAAEAARTYVTAGDDYQASNEYRKDLVAALVKRTVSVAAERAGGAG